MNRCHLKSGPGMCQVFGEFNRIQIIKSGKSIIQRLATVFVCLGSEMSFFNVSYEFSTLRERTYFISRKENFDFDDLCNSHMGVKLGRSHYGRNVG
jgi:hypothetical protein